LLQFCCEDQLLALIHEGGLISKLKGTMAPHVMISFQVDPIVARLTRLYISKVSSLSEDMYRQIEGVG
jgi:hypothetical protein